MNNRLLQSDLYRDLVRSHEDIDRTDNVRPCTTRMATEEERSLYGITGEIKPHKHREKHHCWYRGSVGK